jgi:hypothetical protein
MTLSREARLVATITLLAVPTIMYGGVTLLGILTKGMAGIEREVVSGHSSATLFIRIAATRNT